MLGGSVWGEMSCLGIALRSGKWAPAPLVLAGWWLPALPPPQMLYTLPLQVPNNPQGP